MEFLISFGLSLCVSLILLILIILSERYKERILLCEILGEKIIVFQLFFIAFIYGFILLIPFPLQFLDAKLRLLLILGGSSAICLVILANTITSKFLLITSFSFSTLSVCLFFDKMFLAFLIILAYPTFFVFPLDLVFFVLLCLRILVFPEWGFALFMQLVFLFALKKKSLNFYFLISYFLFCVFTLLIPKDPILIVKFFFFPFSGALAIYYVYLAKNGKEHLVIYFFYFLNGLSICFFFKNAEAPFYFILLNFFFFFKFSYMTLIVIFQKNKRISFETFLEEFLCFVLEKKEKYILRYYGVLLLIIAVYSDSDNWISNWAFSLVLQVGFIPMMMRDLIQEREESK